MNWLICLLCLASPPGDPHLVVPCQVVEVYDGDTVTVEFTLRARVRMLDCWAPEVRSRNADEKGRGLAAKEYLKQLAEGRRGVLTVPLQGERLDDLFTFGRLLGHIHLTGDDESLSEQMVREGHATTTKQKRE